MLHGLQCFSTVTSVPICATRIYVKMDALGSKTTSTPLISKGSLWIRSDNVWFAIVLDPVIQHVYSTHFHQSPCSIIARWIAKATTRLLVSTMIVPSTSMFTTHNASTRSDPLEDKSLAHEELEQQPDEVAISDFLHNRCNRTSGAVAVMTRRACFHP